MTTTPTTLAVTASAAGPGLLPRTVALARLRDLYDSLPTMRCKGLCHDSCTHTTASQLERDLIAERGVTLPTTSTEAVLARKAETGRMPSCPALSPLSGRCTVYEDRPLTCRAFGAVSKPDVPGAVRFLQAMMCDHGCEPEYTLSFHDYVGLVCQVEILSRAATGMAWVPLPSDPPRLKAALEMQYHAEERCGVDVRPFLTGPAGVKPVRGKGKRKSGRGGRRRV